MRLRVNHRILYCTVCTVQYSFRMYNLQYVSSTVLYPVVQYCISRYCKRTEPALLELEFYSKLQACKFSTVQLVFDSLLHEIYRSPTEDHLRAATRFVHNWNCFSSAMTHTHILLNFCLCILTLKLRGASHHIKSHTHTQWVWFRRYVRWMRRRSARRAAAVLSTSIYGKRTGKSIVPCRAGGWGAPVDICTLYCTRIYFCTLSVQKSATDCCRGSTFGKVRTHLHYIHYSTVHYY